MKIAALLGFAVSIAVIPVAADAHRDSNAYAPMSESALDYDLDYGDPDDGYGGTWTGTWEGRTGDGTPYHYDGQYRGTWRPDSRTAYPEPEYRGPRDRRSLRMRGYGPPVVTYSAPGVYYVQPGTTVIIQPQTVTTTTTTFIEEEVAAAPARTYRVKTKTRRAWKARPKPRCICR